MAFAALVPLIEAGGAEAAAGGAAVAGEGAAAGAAAGGGAGAGGLAARAASSGLRFGARAARMHAAREMGQQNSPRPERPAPAMPRENMMGGYENVVNQAQMGSNWG